jgi:hypothetical protein
MNCRSTNNGHEPSIGFDYDAIDVRSPLTADEEFWQAQGELLGDVLRWLTQARSLSGMGARCCVLALYLNPEVIKKSSLKQIASMHGAPGRAALSKAMLEFQRRYSLKPAQYQKVFWMRDRYRRSAIVAHQQQ